MSKTIFVTSRKRWVCLRLVVTDAFADYHIRKGICFFVLVNYDPVFR